MAELPSGTVTFLFTDVEGSTRRWDQDQEAMRRALADHDDVLRRAVESVGGWLFKHTGDGVCAVFRSARAAVDAAVAAQRSLALPVRMGLATGEANASDGDYFGPVLNRTARVMAAGHGGQVLVEGLTAALLDGVGMIDLGEHRLRDLAGTTHLFQVVADGLRADFAPLRTVDSVPGNLPSQVTSFVGRDVEVEQLVATVHAHRLVTLTGVGGVGKTRLALRVAAELAPDWPDGVWLVELAPVGDPSSVPDVVATALGIQTGASVIGTIAEALYGRRALLVLDNCEHVLEAVVTLVETVLARTDTVWIITTSREALGVSPEHVFAVRSLDTQSGTGSAAVTLFVERAQALGSGFDLDDERDAAAVVEICRRLDGIALAIELAAARMVSMTPSDVLDRLADRFRLLAGSRRGLERHQTLRHAIGWSFDLLDDVERDVLCCCAVFADGFTLQSATVVCGAGRDEYAILDALDSLVRKSLLAVERSGPNSRYRMLETIRQFGEDQLAERSGEVRDRHVAHFAAQVTARWPEWHGPAHRAALDWLDAEFGNLRAGYRWAAERGDIRAATAIAAHTAMLALSLQRYEPVGWTEEILPVAASADVPMLPRLYTAASLCSFLDRPGDALRYAREAVRLERAGAHDPFAIGLSGFFESVALRTSGDVEQCVAVCRAMADVEGGFEHVIGRTGWLYSLTDVGRAHEARADADETLDDARRSGNPWLVSFAMDGYGRAYMHTEPTRALAMLRAGLAYAREHRLVIFESFLVRDAAVLTAACDDLDEAFELFSLNIDTLQRSGDVTHMSSTLGQLAVTLAGIGRPDAAATLYGATARYAIVSRSGGLGPVLDQCRDVLGDAEFEDDVAAGAAMELSEAVVYARHQIAVERAARSPR